MREYIYKTFVHEETGKKVVAQYQKESERNVFNFATAILDSEDDIKAAMGGDASLFEKNDWQWTERVAHMIEAGYLSETE